MRLTHGFRSSFRDWAAEETDHPREVIEAALAHVVPNKVEAAYARSDLFERRRRLMDDWMRYLNGQSRTRSRQRVAGPRRSTAAAHPSRMKSGPGAPPRPGRQCAISTHPPLLLQTAA